MNAKLTVGDMFCGAGIGAIGAKQAGFSVGWAFDYNKEAVRTYNINIEDKAYVCDAKDLDYKTLCDVDVITGGFPCQPFSIIGKNEGCKDKDKGNLGKVACDIILYKKPKAFMLENVKGLINKRNKEFFIELIDFISKDYYVTWELIDCSEYGVPQKRERVFVIGVRKDLCKKFTFPAKTHIENKLSILDAIGDIKEKGNYIKNHLNDCGIRNDEKPFVNMIPVGGNWKDLPIEDQKTFMKGGFYSGGGRTGSLHKVNPEKPAKTILSSPLGKATAQILHWKGQEARRYTVRESLRLQTVPDSFYFPDDIKLMKQYERCSGIPALVSYLFMTEISKLIC